MSDLPDPIPQPQQPASSVVLETNTTVKKSRLGLIVAVVVVLGLAAFTIVYFASRDSDDDYTAGPVAQAVVDSLRAAGVDVPLSGTELKCIDRQGKGIDPNTIKDGALDSLDPSSDPALMKFAGAMYDSCFERESRIAIFAAGMKSDGEDYTDEQTNCAAEKLDDAVMDAGGYEQVFSGDEQDLMTLVFGVMGSMADCGIDLGSMMGES